MPIDLAPRKQTGLHFMTNRFPHTPDFTNKLKAIEQSIAMGEFERSVAELNALVKVAGQDPRLFILASRLAHASGNHEGALEAARKAQQVAPDWPVATMYIAGVHADRGEAEPALVFMMCAIDQARMQGSRDLEILHKAADLCHSLGLDQQALVWLREAEQIDPTHSSTRYKIGLALSSQEEFDAAVKVFSALAEEVKGNSALLSARLLAYLGAGMYGPAIEDAQMLLALDPANASTQFYLAVARGEVPATMPSELIASTFDELAPRYDRVMVAGQKYDLPQQVAKQILAYFPSRKFDALDLGCGSGLLGACLGALEGVLVGVDLSLAMINLASRVGVYDKFHHVNLLDALMATPDNLYDVITALDVFAFVGNLDVVIPNVQRILVPGGRFVFTFDCTSDEVARYVLGKTYRYGHRRGYVEQLLRDAGFVTISVQDLVIREEKGQEIPGCLVTAQSASHQKRQQRHSGSEKIAQRSPKNAKRQGLGG